MCGQSNEILGPIEIRLIDTETEKEFSKLLTFEEYVKVLYILKVIEWR